MTGDHLSRAQLVDRVRERMLRTGAPRLLLSSIMVLAACGAFLASVVSLRLGLDSMMLRYPLAVVAGYVVFLALIRGWIAWYRRGSFLDGGSTFVDMVNSIDLGNVSLPTHAAAQPSMFAGGRSGGAGGGAGWSGLASPARSSGKAPTGSGGVGFLVDSDDVWPIALAIACALGGLLAIAYVIYAAPVLLADVALDAAIVSVLYRQLKKREMSHWALTVVRHTWLPAIVLITFAAIGGWALQKAAPDAVSIGGVVRSLPD